MNYKTEWVSSTDPLDTSGIAIFGCGKEEIQFRLPNIKIFLHLCNMFRYIEQQAKEEEHKFIKDKICTLFH